MAVFWDRREKPYVLVLFFLPLVWMVSSLLLGRYFPDPGKALMNLSGIWASIFVVAVLLLSPVARFKSFRVVSRYRRFVGLSAFFYSILHLIVYLVLFAGLSLSWIVSDLIEKPYIYAGVLAVIILSALAITSTKQMMKRMGKNWKRVHRLVYLASICVVAHLWWQVKSDITIAIWFSILIVSLLLLRMDQIPLYKSILKKYRESACAK
ncbi:protein-methionine-sulfoxide reductase heme-binding subunit MsrQ [Marinomonas profundimaris]|uniref:Protein-methionine-sulfoxide reductase heme-binding subunit MsrQ n=1 Tax=Marinomonas profundimaris TaxID=1208321 RepID=W1RUA9_9GAMM|nr:protein-methionine-sulfoxide reductase heme-binding subunit MsrQ [Marinomonas profundimaris]ETI58443.1 membrane protein [Marinomonas profundimaris]